MISMRVTTVGDVTPARLTGMISDFYRQINDLRPAWPNVIAAFRRQERQRFASGNSLGPSGKWQALSPAYARRKAALFAQRPILYLSGLLMDSLAGDSAGSVVRASSSSLFMGTDVPYAIYHQLGTGRMPRRPPIDPSASDVREYVVAIWRHFETVKAKVGFGGRPAGALS